MPAPQLPDWPTWIDLNEITRHLNHPTDWRHEAACIGQIDLMFADGRGQATIAQTNRARALCHTCPVIHECLAEALEAQGWDDWGVFGGTVARERRHLRRHLRIRRRPQHTTGGPQHHG